MTREAVLFGAMRYLAREGAMCAADLGLFAIGDAGLYDRLREGATLHDAEYEEAANFVLTTLDGVSAKVAAGRAQLVEAMATPLRCAA